MCTRSGRRVNVERRVSNSTAEFDGPRIEAKLSERDGKYKQGSRGRRELRDEHSELVIDQKSKLMRRKRREPLLALALDDELFDRRYDAVTQFEARWPPSLRFGYFPHGAPPTQEHRITKILHQDDTACSRHQAAAGAALTSNFLADRGGGDLTAVALALFWKGGRATDPIGNGASELRGVVTEPKPRLCHEEPEGFVV